MEIKVFTNGCFDLIHPGHIDLLERARALGTKLIVGINSDKSVSAIKGNSRPLQNQDARAAVLRGMRAVDEVVIFDEPTPQKLIEKIAPDILVKGGDWKTDEIIGADFVLGRGGKVFSLPLKEGFSTTKIVEKISRELNVEIQQDASDNENLVALSVNRHIKVFQEIGARQIPLIESTAEMIFEVFKAGKKILICGNGGSAADAQHLAAEFVGRYESERVALPAIALTTDTSALTALGNDYGFEKIFSRQVEALASEGDLLIAVSTSGNSPNVIAAVMKAREKGCQTLALTGQNGKKIAALCDQTIMIPSDRTARIQEAHITVAHLWCEIIERNISEKGL